MRRIARLQWTPNNTTPILRRRVRTNEVEEVIAGDYLPEPGHMGRIVLIGPTLLGRMLAVVLQHEGGGTYYPVTARPASRKERRRYREQRGDEAP